MILRRYNHQKSLSYTLFQLRPNLIVNFNLKVLKIFLYYTSKVKSKKPGKTNTGKKVPGQLVPLGFDIAAFTPVAYQRRSLQRPLRET